MPTSCLPHDWEGVLPESCQTLKGSWSAEYLTSGSKMRLWMIMQFRIFSLVLYSNTGNVESCYWLSWSSHLMSKDGIWDFYQSTGTTGDINTLQNRKEMFTDTNIPT